MRWILIPCVFAAVLAGHFLYKTQHGSTSEGSGPWAAYTFEQPEESRLDRYIGPGEYWVGFSYALAGAFASFCLDRKSTRLNSSHIPLSRMPSSA